MDYLLQLKTLMKLFLLLENQKIQKKLKYFYLKKWDFNKSKIEDKILQISDIDKKKLNYLSDTQVKSILDLKLQRLTAIGFDEIDEELKNFTIQLKN